MNIRELSFQAIDFAAALRMKLDGPTHVHINDLQEEVTQEFNQLDAFAATNSELQENWNEIRPHLLGFVNDVILSSAWNRQMDCPYCKIDPSTNYKATEALYKAIEDLPPANESDEDTEQKAEVYYYLLVLRDPDPNPRNRGKRAELIGELMPRLPLEIPSEAYPDAVLTPQTTEINQKRSPDRLGIPTQKEIQPKGEVGRKWEAAQDFMSKNGIDEDTSRWFLMIGPRAAGKTTMLGGSTSGFVCATGGGLTTGESYSTDWWYRADSGMVIDCPGRYTEAGADPSYQAQWEHLLQLLISYRDARPIDGVVLALPMDALMESPSAADKLARHYNQVLDGIFRALQMCFPVYVLFTKTDAVYGFSEFVLRLAPQRSSDIFGWSTTGKFDQPFDPTAAATGFHDLTGRLGDFQPVALTKKADQSDNICAYAFQKELDSWESILMEVLAQLFAGYSETTTVFHRGYYFLSNLQKGRPIRRAYASVQPYEYDLNRQEDKYFSKSFFADQILPGRVFAESGLIKAGPREYYQTGYGSTPFPGARSMQLRVLLSTALLLLFVLISETLELFDILYVETEAGIEMVFIPEGSFLMGSPATDNMRFSDELQHEVILTRPFYLAKYELSQSEWNRIAKHATPTETQATHTEAMTDATSPESPSQMNPLPANPSYFSGQDFPVESVSWNDCDQFIQTINTLYPEDGHYRLPTEAEWEYAARADKQDDLPQNLDEQVWYSANSGMVTRTVGSKASNPWGLYDMNGNVAEWVADWYGPYPQIAVENPTGPADGKRRVARSGAFLDELRPVRSAYRDPQIPTYAFRDTGFRLAWTPPEDRWKLYDFNNQQITFKQRKNAVKIRVFFRAREFYQDNSETINALLKQLWEKLWGKAQEQVPGLDKVPADINLDQIKEQLPGGEGG